MASPEVSFTRDHGWNMGKLVPKCFDGTLLPPDLLDKADFDHGWIDGWDSLTSLSHKHVHKQTWERTQQMRYFILALEADSEMEMEESGEETDNEIN